MSRREGSPAGGAVPARPLAVPLPLALACGSPDAAVDEAVPNAGELTGCWAVELGDSEGVYRPFTARRKRTISAVHRSGSCMCTA